MNYVKLIFADKSELKLQESTLISPIISAESNGEKFATVCEPVELYLHPHDGLIPSVMDVLCNCDFFFINDVRDSIYCKSSIIKVVTG